jgi:uncharacterized membrane protein
MSEQDFGSIPPVPPEEPAAGSEPAWQAVSQPPPSGAGYTSPPPPPTGAGYAGAGYAPPPPGYAPPAGGYAPPSAGAGLSDNAAGALAYITIIPAILFLVLAPYNQKPFVKFHAVQELGLFVVAVCLHVALIVPILGVVVYFVGWACLLVVWVICLIKASQGGAFKLPFIGDFAAQQSGYAV